MPEKRAGSALILVLLLSSLLTVLMLASLKGILWAQAMQSAVIEKEQRLAFAQGALECGIARARDDFDEIVKKSVPLTADLVHHEWTAQVIIMPQADRITVSCLLKKGVETLENINRELAKNDDAVIIIRSIQR